MDKYAITLDREEMNALIFALGLATGTAMNLGMNHFATTIVELANKVNESNSAWTPYVTEKTSQES